jgi:hypothetical protein
MTAENSGVHDDVPRVIGYALLMAKSSASIVPTAANGIITKLLPSPRMRLCIAQLIADRRFLQVRLSKDI